MMHINLFETSPAWAIVSNAILGFDLSLTQGMHITGIDRECRTDDNLAAISHALGDMLCNLPEKAIVRFYSLETSNYDSDLQTYAKQFAKKTVGHILSRQKVLQCKNILAPRKRELYVFVTTPPQQRFLPFNPSWVAKHGQALLKRMSALESSKLQEVNQLSNMVQQALVGIDVKTTMLNADALFHVLWRMANPSSSVPIAPPTYNPKYTLRQQLFAGGLQNYANFYERQGRLHRIATLKMLPKQVVPSQICDLQGFNFPTQLVVTMRRTPDKQAVQRMQAITKRAHEMHKTLPSQTDNARLDKQITEGSSATNALEDGEKLVEAAVQLWFCADDLQTLDKRTTIVCNQFRACGDAEAGIEELRGSFASLSMLPGHTALLGERYFFMLAHTAADLLPVFQAWRGAENPIAYLSSRHQELVGYHPFNRDLSSWNSCIAGGTGKGKSFVMRSLLNGWLAAGGRSIITTRGHDYDRFATIWGGQINIVTPQDHTLALGPFPSVAEFSNPHKTEDYVAQLSSIIGVMVSEPNSQPMLVIKSVIQQAIRQVYSVAKKDSIPNFADFAASLAQQTTASKHEQEAAEQIIAYLNFWLGGPFGQAMLRNRVALSHPLVVWNIEQVTDVHTQSVVLGLLSSSIHQALALTDQGRIQIVFDEVWSILKNPAGANLVETSFRTIRKMGGGIAVISQGVSDFTGLPEVMQNAILNNAEIQIILPHSSNEWPTVDRVFELNHQESKLLRSLQSIRGEYSEFLGFFGSSRKVLRLIPTPLEYWLATSDPDDIAWEKQVRAANPHLSPMMVLCGLAHRAPMGFKQQRAAS